MQWLLLVRECKHYNFALTLFSGSQLRVLDLSQVLMVILFHFAVCCIGSGWIDLELMVKEC